MANLDLCSPEDVLHFPGLGTIPDDDQQWIRTLVSGFSRRAEKYTNRKFYSESRTVELSPGRYGGEFLQLEAFDDRGSVTVTSVKESLAREWAETTAIAATGYWVDNRNGLLYRHLGCWLAGYGTVQVVYTGGLGVHVDQVPDDLRHAATMQCAYYYMRRKDLGVKAKSSDKGGSITVNEQVGFLPDVREILDQYKVESL